MADLQIAVGLRRETRLHTSIVLSSSDICGHHLADEINRFLWIQTCAFMEILRCALRQIKTIDRSMVAW